MPSLATLIFAISFLLLVRNVVSVCPTLDCVSSGTKIDLMALAASQYSALSTPNFSPIDHDQAGRLSVSVLGAMFGPTFGTTQRYGSSSSAPTSLLFGSASGSYCDSNGSDTINQRFPFGVKLTEPQIFLIESSPSSSYEPTLRFNPIGNMCAIYILAASVGSGTTGRLTTSLRYQGTDSGIAIPAFDVPSAYAAGGQACFACFTTIPVGFVENGAYDGTSVGSLYVFSVSPGAATIDEISFSASGSSVMILSVTAMVQTSETPSTSLQEPTSAPIRPPSQAPIQPPTQVANTPSSPPFASAGCIGPSPILQGYNAVCVGGVWKIVGNVSLVTSSVSSFNLTAATVSQPGVLVDGCVDLQSSASAQVSLDPTLVSQIKNGTYQGSPYVLIRSELGCLSGRFGAIGIRCAFPEECPQNCIQGEQRSSSTSLSVVFTSTCSSQAATELSPSGAPWWAILLGVLGAVALIAAVLVIAALRSKKFRQIIFPFRRSGAAVKPETLE